MIYRRQLQNHTPGSRNMCPVWLPAGMRSIGGLLRGGFIFSTVGLGFELWRPTQCGFFCSCELATVYHFPPCHVAHPGMGDVAWWEMIYRRQLAAAKKTTLRGSPKFESQSDGRKNESSSKESTDRPHPGRQPNRTHVPRPGSVVLQLATVYHFLLCHVAHPSTTASSAAPAGISSVSSPPVICASVRRSRA